MRIGFLTYGLDRAPTGIGRYSVELLRALAAQPNGPEIILLTTENEDRHALWANFERVSLRVCRLLPALLTLGNVLLSEATHRLKLDILHDPNGIAPFLGPALGTKRIVTIHDAFAYVHPETHNRLDNWRYLWMLPATARQANAVITVSGRSRQDIQQLMRMPAERLHVIPEGVDTTFKPLPHTAARQAILAHYGIKSPYLLYVGGINARKNIAGLFEAYARVRDQHPGVSLVVAGKRQWQTGEIDTTLRRFNLENDVVFTGYVADGDLPALYSAAEAFVFPSLYEGFGLPPLEAMACGTPVITSNTSSLPEVVGDAAITVDPYDVDALAAAITRVLSDAELRAELRARGLARAAQFTWERAARETLDVYRAVLGRRQLTTDN